MGNLLQGSEGVKWILATLDPHTGNYAAYPATDHGLINIPIAAGTIDPLSLLCTPEEFDHPDAVVHESGFICCFLDEQTVQIPLKDLPRFPFHRSEPADFQMAITEFHRSVQFRDIGQSDILITLWRPVQPGEITQREISHVNRVFTVRQREAQDQDRHDQAQPPGQAPDRHLHIVPPTPGVAQVPEPEKPTPPVDTRSVGLTRKFAFLPPRIWDLMEADSLYMAARQVYTILYTYRKYPEKSRIRTKGKRPLYPLPYTITYQSQMADYLKVRRRDLLATAGSVRRYQARKMGTSLDTVQRAIHRLCESGWILRVYPGRPKVCPWLSPQAQERRDQRHSRVPQWGPQKYLLATDKCQRDLIKGLNRKLKELGLPPYLIYLPGPRF